MRVRKSLLRPDGSIQLSNEEFWAGPDHSLVISMRNVAEVLITFNDGSAHHYEVQDESA